MAQATSFLNSNAFSIPEVFFKHCRAIKAFICKDMVFSFSSCVVWRAENNIMEFDSSGFIIVVLSQMAKLIVFYLLQGQ